LRRQPCQRARIDASLCATEQIRPVPESRDSGVNLWWASSITGLATAIIVIVLLNWNSPVTEIVPVEPVASETVPDYIDELQGLYSAKIKTADFTNPLEDELLRLRADIERARQNVKEDIEFTF